MVELIESRGGELLVCSLGDRTVPGETVMLVNAWFTFTIVTNDAFGRAVT